MNRTHKKSSRDCSINWSGNSGWHGECYLARNSTSTSWSISTTQASARNKPPTFRDLSPEFFRPATCHFSARTPTTASPTKRRKPSRRCMARPSTTFAARNKSNTRRTASIVTTPSSPTPEATASRSMAMFSATSSTACFSSRRPRKVSCCAAASPAVRSPPASSAALPKSPPTGAPATPT